jgi:hypothetical protein
MSNDPSELEDAYERVIDALEFQSGAAYEPKIDPAGSDEQIQLQKACRLLAACDDLYEQGFYRRSRPSASGLDPEGEGRKLG